MRYYGAAYYPEQETAADIERDAELMQQAGFNAVRIGEFAWSSFEPRDGAFEFAWLDHALGVLDRRGIRAVLCTPTACPPAWLDTAHPDIRYRDNRGVVRPFGGRRHYCPNSPTYRRFCARIADAIAGRYGADPRVVGLHIDNELGQEATGRCQCDTCVGLFRGWLERKYGTIGRFNQLAGTVFWSQTYDSFAQVHPPLRSIEPNADQQQPLDPFVDNPTLRLDWERFSSDSITGFQEVQAAALRRHSRTPVTTNATGFWTNSNDLHASFAGLDVAGGDIYPSLRADDMYGAACDFAFHRGLKRSDFWVLETSSGGGQGVWGKQGILQPFPGTMRQNAIHAFASGASLVTYFQWRTFRYGAEQLEAAVMDIDGIPRRRFREFQAAAADLARLAPLLDRTRIRHEVAIVFDYASLWATRIKPFHRGFSYQGQVQQIHAALIQGGIGADVIGSGTSYAGYRLLIVPTPVVMDQAQKAALEAFVRAGGTVVTNFLAAIKDEHNTAPRASVPAGLTELFGVRVAEGEPVIRESWQDTSAAVAFTLAGVDAPARTHTWTESLEPLGAEVVATYADTWRAGEPIATRNRVGTGTAWYLGTWFDEAALIQLLAVIAASAGVRRAPFRFGRGVEAVRRTGDDGRHLFIVFNHRERESAIDLDGPCRDALDGAPLSGSLTLAAKQYRLLEPA